MPRPVAPRVTRVPDIRHGDTVLVLDGKDAGKRGTVERLERPDLAGRPYRVVVEGINIAKRHTKPRPKQGRTERQPRIQQGGILDVPQPILASKVMVVCPHCGQPTRVRHGVAGDGRSVRLCGNCGETLTSEAKKKK